MKISPMGVEFFHADGQTAMKKLRVASSNFWSAPNQGFSLNKVSSVRLISVT
jgi:hypothetical protein